MRRVMILLMAFVSLFLPVMAEEAAEAAVIPEVVVTLSQNSFDAPGPVEVDIVVKNTSGRDMSGPCALYDPSGVRITEFGQPTLAAGESTTWNGTWSVTQEQLEAEQLLFTLMYAVPDTDNNFSLKRRPFSVPITYTPAEAAEAAEAAPTYSVEPFVPVADDFYGTWTVLYYVENGVARLPEEGLDATQIIITAERAVPYSGSTEGPLFTISISDNILSIDGAADFHLVSPDLMICEESGMTAILQRTAPAPFDSPFAGTWQPLLAAGAGEIILAGTLPEEELYTLSFGADFVTISPVDEDAYSYLTFSLPVTYDGNTCRAIDGGDVMTMTIDSNGLMTMTNSWDSFVVLLVPVP